MNSLCRKCHTSLDEEIPEPIQVVAAPVETGNGHGHRRFQIAVAIRSLRHRGGLSQRQLALRMHVPRTYVSKIENDKATPTLSSLERLALALEVTVSDLLDSCGHSHDEQVRELLSDEFISSLAPFVCKLDPLQRQTFLTQVRELTTRPRRNA